jgi:hypothetical protein
MMARMAAFFHDQPEQLPPSYRQALIVLFWPVVLLVLGLDSRWLLAAGFNGQPLCTVAAPLYLLLVVAGLPAGQRLAVLVFVPFSALGEYLFSIVFGLYEYKFHAVPLYVPFGHAILFATGLLIEGRPWVQRHLAQVRWALVAFLAALFAGAIIALGDTLSLVLGLLFLLILYRKRARLIYLIMGVLVLYIELVGTALGCWIWRATAFDLLHTTNPPVGAFVCYVIADILVLKIALRLAPYLRGVAAPQLTTRVNTTESPQ